MSAADSWFQFFGLIIGFLVLTDNFGFISPVKLGLVSQITADFDFWLIIGLWFCSLIIAFQVLNDNFGFISQVKIRLG